MADDARHLERGATRDLAESVFGGREIPRSVHEMHGDLLLRWQVSWSMN
jgi:hypothetical protein